MKIFQNIFNSILFICVLVSSEQTADFGKAQQTFCSYSQLKDEQCGGYCYKIVKHLLQYAASVQTKEQLYIELLEKVNVLDISIKYMEQIIRDKQMQLEMQFELNNIHKKNAAITEELLNEKNRQLLELQAQIECHKLEKNSDSLDKSLNGLGVQSEVLYKNKNSLDLINTEKSLHSKDNSLDDKGKGLVKNLETISKLNFPIDKYVSSNCLDKSNDIYLLKVPGLEPFPVLCDSTLAGSGWTVVQRRQDGTENFNRNWQDYRAGFGDLRGEFFMGLETLHRMTKAQSHELFIHLEDFHNETRYAQYNYFVIGNEHESYKIESLGEYSGNADDALLQHKNCKFSTPDRPVAGKSNCAELYQSGWWFNSGCYLCNLNGQYITQNIENLNAIEWRTWHFRPLKFVQMMIRPNK